MRIYVDILKAAYGDCTNNGLSSKHDCALLIWDETEEEIRDKMPKSECIFILDNGYGHRKFMAVPFGEKRRAMFGGNFLYSSDSRFPSDQPIHIHDRIEG